MKNQKSVRDTPITRKSISFQLLTWFQCGSTSINNFFSPLSSHLLSHHGFSAIHTKRLFDDVDCCFPCRLQLSSSLRKGKNTLWYRISVWFDCKSSVVSCKRSKNVSFFIHNNNCCAFTPLMAKSKNFWGKKLNTQKTYTLRRLSTKAFLEYPNPTLPH